MIPLRRVSAALALTLLVGSGCSDDDNEAASTTTRPPTTTTSSSTTTTASSTTVDTAGIEGPAEWVPVVADLYQRMHDLKAHPDLARVATVFSENCPCYADERETVQFLVDEGLHLEGQPTQVLRVEVADERPGRVRLTVTSQAHDGRLVRADGTVAQEVDAPASPGRASIVLVADGENGAHRVFDFQEFGS